MTVLGKVHFAFSKPCREHLNRDAFNQTSEIRTSANKSQGSIRKRVMFNRLRNSCNKMLFSEQGRLGGKTRREVWSGAVARCSLRLLVTFLLLNLVHFFFF